MELAPCNKIDCWYFHKVVIEGGIYEFSKVCTSTIVCLYCIHFTKKDNYKKKIKND